MDRLRKTTLFTLPRAVSTLAAAALLVATLSGCGIITRAVGADAASQGPAAGSQQAAASGSVVLANGHGWSEAGLDGPVPTPSSCHASSDDGSTRPDPTCTPGSIDGAVTQENIDQTIGRSGGYTTSVRPPMSLTTPAKRALMAAYGIPTSEMRDYELDHLVPLCAGGSSDVRNLWPEPNEFVPGDAGPSTFVQNSKDRVESYICTAIREHRAPLAAAQQAIASDWTTAVAVLGLAPIPAGYGG